MPIPHVSSHFYPFRITVLFPLPVLFLLVELLHIDIYIYIYR